MKILVTGATGQVGTDLVQVLAGITPRAGVATALLGMDPVAPGEFDVMACGRVDLDITTTTAIEAVIESGRPDVVVNLAAYTKVDLAEDEPDLAYAVNEGGVATVARACERYGARLLHISTDYVFSGELGRPLCESDVPDPQSVYGASKFAGERHVHDGAVVRSSWIVGLGGRTVIDVAMAAAAEGRTLQFVADQVGTLTASADLAAGLVAFVREPLSGVIHLAGSGEASWYEIIATALEMAGGSRDQVSPIATRELQPAQRAKRPAYSPLISERLGDRRLPAWQDGLERLIKAKQAS